MPENAAQPLPIRMCYIGVVSLLCRAHEALGRERQAHFDGEPEMERVAEHFNAQGFTIRMERSATGWSLFDAPETVENKPVKSGRFAELVP